MRRSFITMLVLLFVVATMASAQNVITYGGGPVEGYEPLEVSGGLNITPLSNQFVVTITAEERPSMAYGEAGYKADGYFWVNVANGDCAGTYTVNATPVANSGPDGSTPPITTVMTYIGFGQGNFYFGNAGAGSYTVTVTNTNGDCTQDDNPVVTTAKILNGVPIPLSNWAVVGVFAAIFAFAFLLFRRFF